MPTPLESNFLVLDERFVLLLGASVVVGGLLVLWPLIETIVRQQWGYTLGVIVLGPIGGLIWFFIGRRGTLQHRGVESSTGPTA